MAPHCCGFHSGGWGDKWLDKADETLLKHFAIVSKTFIHFIQPFTATATGEGCTLPQGTAAAGWVYFPHSTAPAVGQVYPPPALICVPVRPNACL